MATLDQHVRAFLRERRLSEDEITAVMKMVKGDPVLGEMSWGDTETSFSPNLLASLRDRVRLKVLRWMDKYRTDHPGRALFTGES